MTNNANLIAAKKAKQDEFYTCRETIEDELQHYRQFFEGKTVYCNCDDPETSEFWRFFVRVFRSWRLKKLMATHYDPNEKNYSYRLELTGDGKDKPTITQIPCNGDFRSAACIELLKEADIVCTNPPFSLIREYATQLVAYKKDFIIMAPLNAVHYKEIFPLIQQNKIWLGYKPIGQDTLFHVPKYYAEFLIANKKEGSGYKIVNGEVMGRANVIWLTNLDISKRHETLDLRGNYFIPGKFRSYENYDGIDIPKVSDMPCDYSKGMGVPVSFLGNYNPDQFEIVGLAHGNLGVEMGLKPYDRKLRPLNKGLRDGDLFYMDDGIPKVPFIRLVVKLKHPEPRRYPD